jgi:hypothetical protein
MWGKGDNSIRENSIMFISWNVWEGKQLNKRKEYYVKIISRNVGERETTQLEKIVLCVSPEMCQKGHNSIRENGIMFISWNVWKGR